MTGYTLIRARRKTMALYIKDGAVEVRAPLRLSKAEIDRFVASKQSWITKKLAEFNEQAAQRESFSLYYGGCATYRGTDYPIEDEPGKRCGFDGARFFMPPGLDSDEIKAALVAIYKKLAKRDICEKVKQYEEIMGVSSGAVKVNSAKTRWGSCSGKRSLNFSWRLIMADDSVIDYVVAHELAHLLEMNHSPRFWAIVAHVMPDHKKRRAKLKELQSRLSREDW